MPWTKGEQDFDEFTAEDGEFRKRIVPQGRGAGRFRIEDFYRGKWERGGVTCDSETEARAEVEDMLKHTLELKTLPRRERYLGGGDGIRTPWGQADSITAYSEGVTGYGTPSHGGTKLDAARNRKVHPAWRKAGGWYEEDSDHAIVIQSLPELFTQRERAKARQALMNWMPHEYMAATGETLTEENSLKLRQDAFDTRHAGDWITVAASGQDDGFVRVHAVIGGRAKDPLLTTEVKVFLVPDAEYAARTDFFVIDPARHQEAAEAPTPRI